MCKKQNTYVLEVDNIFVVTGVSEIDVANESLEVDMYLMEIKWTDPELGVCEDRAVFTRWELTWKK